MKRTAIGIVCAALAAPLAWSPNARAVEPAADIVAKQRVLFEQGNTLYDAQRWSEARDAFLAAWKLKRSYDVAANLGDVELLLGEARSAAEHLAYALREFPAGGKPALRATLTKRFDEARRLVGALRIQVSKPGAEVFVDGRAIGYAPIDDEVFVEPGAHELFAKQDGYVGATAKVEAKAGGAADVTLTLGRTAAPATPPATALPAPSGGSPAAHTHLAPEAKRSWVPVVVLGAASAVGLGVGVGFTVASNGANDEARAQSRSIRGAGGQCVGPSTAFAEPCAQLDRRGLEASTLGYAAFGSYIASGVFALAAATYVLWPSRAGTGSTGVSVRPDVRLDGSGILVVGTW
ncbi:PEGA domain-containing protein [Sorangium sp. KYC3313]|uniref:PEGA domain-containing protein n=1 Tax=Sorangium sp. KYC3313 TaxID=3449740 RepID=UPI003F88CAC8